MFISVVVYTLRLLFCSLKSKCAPRFTLICGHKTSWSISKELANKIAHKYFLFFKYNWPMQLSKSNSVICFLVNCLRAARLAVGVLPSFLSRFVLRILNPLRETPSLGQPPAMVASIRFINQEKTLLSMYEKLYFRFVSLFVCDLRLVHAHRFSSESIVE